MGRKTENKQTNKHCTKEDTQMPKSRWKTTECYQSGDKFKLKPQDTTIHQPEWPKLNKTIATIERNTATAAHRPHTQSLNDNPKYWQRCEGIGKTGHRWKRSKKPQLTREVWIIHFREPSTIFWYGKMQQLLNLRIAMWKFSIVLFQL